MDPSAVAQGRIQAALTTGLGDLDLSNLGLTELPEIPEGIEFLDCKNNKLTEISRLPSTLQWLDCSRNFLSKLENLPRKLESLLCHHNSISKLENLPNTLEFLYCEHNALTKLPSLPKFLTVLNCSDNPLQELPLLPKRLQNIYIHGIYATLQPPFQRILDTLDMHSNEMTSRLKRALTRYYATKNKITNLESFETVAGPANKPHVVSTAAGPVRVGLPFAANSYVGNIVGSFLSGKSGPLREQKKQLERNLGTVPTASTQPATRRSTRRQRRNRRTTRYRK